MKPSPDATPRRLSGTVQAGVEANCLLLSEDGTGVGWLLLGDTGTIRAGDQVTVEGRSTPDVMTTCQQGQPFTVLRVL